MQAEIITIGDEILIGQITDTNSAWLGYQLSQIGIRVVRITSVRDNMDAIKACFDEALAASDLVIVTGGLGPTKDDITKHTLAEYFDSPLVFHQPTHDFLKKMLEDRGIDFNVLNQSQAYVPQHCTVLPNLNGTAPGMWFERGGKILVSMPGVPFEMKGIFESSVVPKLKKHFALKSIVHKTAIIYGIPESALALRIAEWEDALPHYIKLAYLPNSGQVRLRLSAYEVDASQASAEIDLLFEKLKEIVPSNFLGFAGVSLEKVVAGMLAERGETLSVAESCSGGALAAAFTAMPGASVYFKCGVVAYANEIKQNILGVKAKDLETYGAVSQSVAEQMAEGVKKLASTTYSISVTGVAGPTGGSEEKPVGTVWIAVSTPDGIYSVRKSFGNQRDENIRRTVSFAINFLREKIFGI